MTIMDTATHIKAVHAFSTGTGCIHKEHRYGTRLPQKWRPVDFDATDEDSLFAPFGGCYDVMNDGSMILLPTPGHTPGSLSMLIRMEGKAPLLLVGDLTYQADLLMNDQIPGTGDKAQLLASYAKVRGLRERLPGLRILPAHDFASKELLSNGYAQGAPDGNYAGRRFRS